ncbi:MAG: TIGR01459 family HAD-type hydrolase [Rickettsiales bacterium]|jgi:HAD superfamily hydrolase (TIGR01459 family)|nr:TIGR01459 family HAD-type hydrolase [Rickettsiales bacterium]
MIYKNLMEIADNFDTFFFDAWGVFNVGGKISKSAIDVMAELVYQGKSVSIMSNTPQSMAGAIVHYGKRGLTQGIHFQNIFSSGQLCKDAADAAKIPAAGTKYYVAWDNSNNPIVNKSYNLFIDSDYVKVSDINKADFVYCDFPTYNESLITDEALMEPELSKVISAGKPVICANPDLHAFFTDERFITQGTPCKIFEQVGLPVIYYGKPYAEIYLDAMAKLKDVNPRRTLMIGDTLHTDILGAKRAGIKSCLTLAGGIGAGELIAAGQELTVENINAAGESVGAVPDYIIEKVPAVDL